LIVSGIWWKRVEGPLRAIALIPLLVIGGCGFEQFLLGRPTDPEQPEPLPPPRSAGPQTNVGAGLSPLLTPQQVLTAVPFGRPDPFAPTPGTAPPRADAVSGASAARAGAPATAGTAAAAAQPASTCQSQGLRLTGVIRSGGRAEALVSVGPLSGTLRIGDRGGRSTDLLPAGCVLASIHFGGFTPADPPSITLQRGQQREKVTL
jgi:hypothetical protein